jgi:hypothetical protein
LRCVITLWNWSIIVVTTSFVVTISKAKIVLTLLSQLLFKMSTHGITSCVELVWRMMEFNLQGTWVAFNHVKCIHNWTTIITHVYDSCMRSMQIIAICNMKGKDKESIMLFWTMLNDICVIYGILDIQFIARNFWLGVLVKKTPHMVFLPRVQLTKVPFWTSWFGPNFFY